jgi:hypothetical protein
VVLVEVRLAVICPLIPVRVILCCGDRKPKPEFDERAKGMA